MNHRITALLLLALAAAHIGTLHRPTTALAQSQPSIGITVQAGYDSAYRVDEWFPVVVTIANDGADVRAVLEWSFPGQPDEPTFRQTIDLPRGARKRVVLNVSTGTFARDGRIDVLNNGTSLVSQDVRIDPIDTGVFLVGVVSSDPALLNSLSALPSTATGHAIVRHLATLPEHVAALRGIDVLFLHDIDTNMLSADQRAALALWVRLGGQLVVSGGANGQQATAALADLLPVDISDRLVTNNLIALGSLIGAAAPQATSVALSEVRPRAGAEPFPAGSPLLYRWSIGNGAVTFSTFDIASLRGWTGEPMLWAKLLTQGAGVFPGSGARQSGMNVLQGVLQLPQLRLPAAGILVIFLLVYVLVIGPLNYLLLRRLRRLEWAWMTVPLVVLVFAGGLYILGVELRGSEMQLNQVSVVQGVEGQAGGFATGFVGLFSPRRAITTLTFPADTLVTVAGSSGGFSDQMSHIASDDTGVIVPDVLIDIAALRTFTIETTTEVPVSVQSTLHDDNGTIRGAIRNNGSRTIEDALLIHGEAFQQLGTIAPGASQVVALDSTANNFPQALNLPNTGRFNRQQLLNMLFSNGANRSGNAKTIDGHGVYLLAWSNQPIIDVQVDNQPPSQNALTLYIIRLRA